MYSIYIYNYLYIFSQPDLDTRPSPKALAFFTRCLAKLQSKRSDTSPEASWKARTKSPQRRHNMVA